MIQHPTDTPDYIYKITTNALWAKVQTEGVLEGMPIDINDGYMHFSTAEQLVETLSLHFRGQSDIVVLKVALAPIAENVKWEPSRGGALFPHLYGQLSTDHIVKSGPASVDADGKTQMPDLD